MKRNSAILNAMVKNKPVAEIKKLIEAGFDINYQTVMGLTPMSHAVAHQKMEYVNLLIQHGAGGEADESSSLLEAIQNQLPLDAIKKIWDQSKEVNGEAMMNEADENGLPPICYAIDSGSLELIQYLVEEGAVLDQELSYNDDFDGTPFMFALYLDSDWKIIEYLAKESGGINQVNSTDETPLMLLSKCSSDADKVKKLLDLGASETMLNKNNNGGAAIDYARHNDSEAKEAIIELVIGSQDATLTLIRAIYENKPIEQLRKLADQVTDYNQTVTGGNTPLLAACSKFMRVEIVALLLEKGADPNQADEKGNSPLSLAIEQAGMQSIVPLSEYNVGYRKDTEDIEAVNRYLLDPTRMPNIPKERMPDIKTDKESHTCHAKMSFNLKDRIPSQAPELIKALLKAGADPKQLSENDQKIILQYQ